MLGVSIPAHHAKLWNRHCWSPVIQIRDHPRVANQVWNAGEDVTCTGGRRGPGFFASPLRQTQRAQTAPNPPRGLRGALVPSLRSGFP